MIFIMTGETESGPVSFTCDSARAALERARGMATEGVRDIIIDADGQEYSPADFGRRFTGSRSGDGSGETAEQVSSGVSGAPR
jgi:hypothetical protein